MTRSALSGDMLAIKLGGATALLIVAVKVICAQPWVLGGLGVWG